MSVLHTTTTRDPRKRKEGEERRRIDKRRRFARIDVSDDADVADAIEGHVCVQIRVSEKIEAYDLPSILVGLARTAVLASLVHIKAVLFSLLSLDLNTQRKEKE